MELYNCVTPREIELENIELILLNNRELIKLAREIKRELDNDDLGDELVATSALLQISEELYRRLEV